jgi:hypothetical protein
MSFFFYRFIERWTSALRMAWYLERRALLAAGLLMLAAALLAVVVIPRQLWSIRGTEREIAALGERLQQPMPAAAVSPIDETIALFPTTEAEYLVLRDIASARERHGLLMGEITLRSEAGEAARLKRTEYEVMVTGAFPKVRVMLSGLLQRHPTLALDSIEVRRTGPDAPFVEAQLRFALYMRKGPVPK